MYYYRARYYSPVLGRFLQRDPLTWAPNDPRISYGRGLLQILPRYVILGIGLRNPTLSHNYNYCFNNPTNYTDPNGEAVLEAIAVVAGRAVRRGLVSGVQAGLGTALVSGTAASIRGERGLTLFRTIAVGFARGFTSGFIAGSLSSLGVPLPAARTIGGTVSGFIFGNPVSGIAGGLASGISGIPNPFLASTVGSTVSEAFAPTELGRDTTSILSERFNETMEQQLNKPIGVEFGKPDIIKTKK